MRVFVRILGVVPIATLAIICGSPARADSDTYNFVATIIDGTGIFASLTGQVTGTLTFDNSTLTGAASQSGLSLVEYGGDVNQTITGPGNVIPPDPWPFSESVTVGNTTYASPSTSDFAAYSYEGESQISAGPGYYSGSMEASFGPDNFSGWGFGSDASYGDNGLPIFSASTSASGDFGIPSDTGIPNGLEYQITSITPVAAPEFDVSTSGLMLLAGALLVLRGRRPHAALLVS